MKIGLVIYGSLDILTGGFFYDRKVVEYLKSRGHEVEIFSLPWRMYHQHLFDNFSREFLNKLTSAKIDILVQDELNHPSLFLLNRKLLQRVKYPITSIVHHLRSDELRPLWQNRLYSVVEKAYLSTVHGFVFNSKTTMQSVHKRVGAGRPWVVAHPGRSDEATLYSETVVKKRAFEAGPLRILFVGALIPRKELHTLITALSRVPKDNWELTVVGSRDADPAYAHEIDRLIAGFSIGQRVKFVGTVPHEKLAELYGSSHILAVPSSYEGFGIVYLEAMGYGLPAVATTAGAAHEVISDGVDGFLTTPGDVQALVNIISDLNRDRSKLVRMGTAALSRFASHPTWDESAEKIADFLENMVK